MTFVLFVFLSSSYTVTTRTLSTFPADGSSSVLENVHLHSGVTPLNGVTWSGPPPPPSDATVQTVDCPRASSL